MHNIIKEETKNLNIYNLSKSEMKDILYELFRYYGEIELLPIYRWNWNHVRVYPWLWIKKEYIIWDSKPFDLNFFKNLKKISNNEKIELHNIYSNKKCIARNLDMKAYFFDRDYSWDLYYLYEILFLKLFKNWLIDIKLFSFKHDINTKVWKRFYAFMDKYNIKSNEFHSSESWKTEYDISSIIKNSYKEFISHILENIILKWNVNDEYEFSNRLDFIATIPSIKIFFEKLHSMLSKHYENNKYLKEEFIKLLNISNNIIKIPFDEYFKEKVQFFEYLKYLESKNKLAINKVYQEKLISKPHYIVFDIEKYISKFETIHLINYEKIENEIIVNFKNNELFIYWNKIKFNKWSKIWTLYKLVFDYFIENNTNNVSFENLIKYYELNKIDYIFEKTPEFKYDYFRRDVEKKNESLEIKDFLGINYSWFSCQYFNPEIN